jgi:hypothetical protein
VSLRDLLVLYGIVGVACAVAVLRRGRATGKASAAAAVVSAVATLFVWPLWAPFALGAPAPRAPAPSGGAGTAPAGALARIQRALEEAVAAVAGTPMSDVFPPRVAQRIGAEVARVASRLDELGALTARAGFDAEASARTVHDLEAGGAPERTIATARLQHDSLVRLLQLRAADAQALDDLAGLLEALRTQLLLARYSGASADGAGAIVSEVWARLEGIGLAFDGSAAAGSPGQ